MNCPLKVEEQLSGGGFNFGRQAHALSHDGARYFGILEIELPGSDGPPAKPEASIFELPKTACLVVLFLVVAQF